MSHLRTSQPALENRETVTRPASTASNAGIPRRIHQSTLAMQIGIAPRTTESVGTTTLGQLDYSYSTPFDYQSYLARSRPTERAQSRPQFRSKVVCLLSCKHCEVEVCKRGMKAILLADMNVELFSTDSPPYGVQLVLDDYQTRNCFCRIRDVACLGW